MNFAKPYLLFLGDAADPLAAKTATGIAHWRPADCVGQLRLPGCNADLGVPDMDVTDAVAQGARTLIVGVANRGGRFAQSWAQQFQMALEAGLDIASGLHNRLTDIPGLSELAIANGRKLFDVRHSDQNFDVATGTKRSGKRLLTVGTDCSVGKMYTALAIESELRHRGISATFRATGQTGILITGSGISVDAVVADFISGAVEQLAPANEPSHWDIIEGQGSLFHPSFAGVSLGLLHGAQPDCLVMCHEPGRAHMRGVAEYPLPTFEECIVANEGAARLTNRLARVIGFSINTSSLETAAAETYLKNTEDRLGLPCVDPVRNGVGPLVDAMNN